MEVNVKNYAETRVYLLKPNSEGLNTVQHYTLKQYST